MAPPPASSTPLAAGWLAPRKARATSARLAPLLLGGLAVAAGAPLYFVLDRLHALPPALRERPWPLEAGAALASIAALALALTKQRRCAPHARLALGGGLVATCATVAFAVLAGAASYRLPPPLPGCAVGRPPPATELVDAGGQPFHLSSLRGAPALLVFFRGAT